MCVCVWGGGGVGLLSQRGAKTKRKVQNSFALNDRVTLAGNHQRLWRGRVSVFPGGIADRPRWVAGKGGGWGGGGGVKLNGLFWNVRLASQTKTPPSLFDILCGCGGAEFFFHPSFVLFFWRTCGANCITWRNVTRSEAATDYMY